MLTGVVITVLRAVCAVLALVFGVVIVTIYVPVLLDNADSAKPEHLPPLFVALFGFVVLSSFILRRGRWRETAMMVASFGWVISMGVWFATVYGWSMANGVPVREVLQGYSGPLFNFVAMMLFTANGLLSLRSLHRLRPLAE